MGTLDLEYAAGRITLGGITAQAAAGLLASLTSGPVTFKLTDVDTPGHDNPVRGAATLPALPYDEGFTVHWTVDVASGATSRGEVDR